ncbi:MAG: DUF58 domain-containing protein [Candidatus Hydrothermia bacterium]|nr:DUF58 domain-containing protein [Candidatus Hydrothermae bacterium]
MSKVRPFVSRVKLKKWGRYYAVLTLLLGFAAVSSGNNLLYFFLGALLSIMALSGFASYLSLKNLRMTIIPPEELYARNLNFVKVKVTNRGPFPVFLIYVKKSEEEKTLFDIIPAKGEREGLLPYYFDKRGYVSVDSAFIGTSFPFSFTIREMFYPLNVKVLVFPHIFKISAFERANFAKNSGHGTDSKKEGSTGDFMGLREYTNGDSVSRIYWKKISEKSLFVKRFYDEDLQELTLEIPSDASEKEIEQVASIAVSLLAEGHSVGLAIDGRVTLTPGSGIKQKVNILKKLALLGYED